MLHVENNHLVCAISMASEENYVNIYNVYNVKFVDAHKHTGCGLFAIAKVTIIVFSGNPSSFHYLSHFLRVDIIHNVCPD